MKKFILIFSGVIAVLGCASFFLLKKQEKTVSFTAFPSAHNYLSLYREKEEIEFEIFFNRTDSLFTEAKAVSEAWISDSEKENLFALELKEIRKTENQFTYNGETYRGYLFSFTAGIYSEEDFEFLLPEAYLCLLYRGEKEIMLPVGSFAFGKIASFGSDELYITRLQGIVNEIDGIKTLVGICMSLKNKTASEIILKAIHPASASICGAQREIVFLGEREIDSGIPIAELLGAYDPYSCEEGDAEMEIPPYGDMRILVPLKYKKLLPASRLAFRIEYDHSGEGKTYYFYEFTFFTDHRYGKERLGALLFQTDEYY